MKPSLGKHEAFDSELQTGRGTITLQAGVASVAYLAQKKVAIAKETKLFSLLPLAAILT